MKTTYEHSRPPKNRLIHFTITTLFFSFLTITPTQAEITTDTQGIRNTLDQCLDNASGVDPDIRDCLSDEIEYQDKRLNKAYQELLASLSPKRQLALRKAQRLWISFREKNCAFYWDSEEGGTADRIMAQECELDHRASRAKELEGLKSVLGLK